MIPFPLHSNQKIQNINLVQAKCGTANRKKIKEEEEEEEESKIDPSSTTSVEPANFTSTGSNTFPLFYIALKPVISR